MNKQSKVTYLLLATTLLIIGASACKKSENGGSGGSSADFAGKRWVVQSMVLSPAFDLDGDGQPDNDMMAFTEPCELDNVTVFRKDGKVVIDQGALRCDEEADQEQVTGTWVYDTDSKQLTISENGEEPSVMEVVETTDQRLKVKQSATVEGGVVYSVIITFRKV